MAAGGRPKATALRRFIIAAAMFAAVALLYLTGQLHLLDGKLAEERFRLLPRPATGDLVIVSIDPESLAELGVWPWPRRFHAAALDALSWIGAAEVAFDVDFSVPSDPANDAALAAGLNAAAEPVILPAFVQSAVQVQSTGELVLSEPIEALRGNVLLGSVNIQPEADGKIWQVATAYPWRDGTLPALSARLAGLGPEAPRRFGIDFGIDLATIPQIRFTDLVHNRVDPRQLAGKRVLIGATAVELGDIVNVPVWGAISGVLLQAAATETILQGRMLQPVPPAVILAGIALILGLMTALLPRWRRGWGLLTACAIAAGSFGVALLLQQRWGLMLDTGAWTVAAALGFVGGLVLRLDDLTWRLLIQGFWLRRQDALMRQVVQNTFDALITTDDAGRILSFNPAAERMFRQPAANVTGRGFDVLLSAGMVQDLGPGGPGAILARLAGAAQPLEGMARRADGKEFCIDVAATRVADADPPLFVLVVRDIDARKQAEATAHQAQTRLALAVESMSSGFALFDEQQRLVLCNQHYREMAQTVADRLQPGTPFAEITAGVAQQRARRTGAQEAAVWASRRLARFANPEGPFEQETESGRWLRIDERRTPDQGWVTVITDISEVKQRQIELGAAKETAELASRAKTDFLANMSHELRTPLNAILGFSEMMMTEMMGPMGSKIYLGYSRDIHNSAGHLLAIISDILDISKVESGKLRLSEGEVAVAQEVAAAIRLSGMRAADQGVFLRTEVPADLPRLRADARLIKQMLVNLLSNSVKFTPAGGVVTVAAGLDGQDGSLLLSVRDTGVGIPAAEIERVLLPFGQVESAFARKHGGVGLGLPLVKSFVELHGGQLSLTSEVGVGTEVVLRFPADRVIAEPGAEPAESVATGRARRLS